MPDYSVLAWIVLNDPGLVSKISLISRIPELSRLE